MKNSSLFDLILPLITAEIPTRVTAQARHAEKAGRWWPLLFTEGERRNGSSHAGETTGTGQSQTGGLPQSHRNHKLTLANRASCLAAVLCSHWLLSAPLPLLMHALATLCPHPSLLSWSIAFSNCFSQVLLWCCFFIFIWFFSEMLLHQHFNTGQFHWKPKLLS